MRTVVHHSEIQCLIPYRHEAYRAPFSFYLTHSTTILHIFPSARETNKCLTKWRREVCHKNYLLVTAIPIPCVTVTCYTSTEGCCTKGREGTFVVTCKGVTHGRTPAKKSRRV